ncbi:MAG: hypothetical protein KGL35_24360 [Bradyrhizobium sp.]|nr:hypothetical protein [Bradyrhizobium sp.]
MSNVPTTYYRGTTIIFNTTFYDQTGAVSNPPGAALHLSYIQNGVQTEETIEMTAPVPPSNIWSAEWDSRGVSPGTVAWSIHSEGSVIPYAVSDGSFILSANNANLLTF